MTGSAFSSAPPPPFFDRSSGTTPDSLGHLRLGAITRPLLQTFVQPSSSRPSSRRATAPDRRPCTVRWMIAAGESGSLEAEGFSHLLPCVDDPATSYQGGGSPRRRSIAGPALVLSAPTSVPFEQHFYRCGYRGAMENITSKSATTAPCRPIDGSWDVYSYVHRPARLFLRRNRAGSEMSQLTLSPTPSGVGSVIVPSS